jgi:cephalosporin-C deacetylase-like acetyl esterase
MYASRRAATMKGMPQLRDMIRTRLDIASAKGAPVVQARGQLDREGYRIEKIAMESEPGITVPALVFVPQKHSGARMPAVIVANEKGKSADAGPGGKLEALARAGYLVVAADLRGLGESSAPDGKSGYKGPFQTDMRAVLLGKSMMGMQTYDLLRVFNYTAARKDVDADRISVIGQGSAGVVALYAAALEPRIHRTVIESSVLSYMDVVRSKMHQNITDLVVPGVLKDFDLPDLAKAVGKGKLIIVGPKTPTGEAAPLEQAKSEYGPGVQVLDRLSTTFSEFSSGK